MLSEVRSSRSSASVGNVGVVVFLLLKMVLGGSGFRFLNGLPTSWAIVAPTWAVVAPTWAIVLDDVFPADDVGGLELLVEFSENPQCLRQKESLGVVMVA